MKKIFCVPIKGALVSMLLLIIAGFSVINCVSKKEYGSLENPIIDSSMSLKEAMDGLSPDCPKSIKQRQRLITVQYYSFDGYIHQGQLLIDKALVKDIQAAFAVARKDRFEIFSVVPISDIRFRKNGAWDDDLSMAANNSSCFNYRSITGAQNLSMHAFGRAVDINPVQNPYIKDQLVLPPGAVYNPEKAGTLTKESGFVAALLARGWSWGGEWTSPKDYQHLEK